MEGGERLGGGEAEADFGGLSVWGVVSLGCPVDLSLGGLDALGILDGETGGGANSRSFFFICDLRSEIWERKSRFSFFCAALSLCRISTVDFSSSIFLSK